MLLCIQTILAVLFTSITRTKTSDIRLVQDFLNGDAQAQWQLHQEVDNLVEKALQGLEAKGSRFRDRANIRQEIIVTIMVNDEATVLRKFKGDSKLSTYLWSVIRFKLIDKLRQEMTIANRKEELSEDIPQNVRENPNELFGLVDQFLDRLSEKDAFILRAKWFDHLDYDSICREAAKHNLKVDKTYIGNLLFKMRKKISGFLKNHGYEFDT